MQIKTMLAAAIFTVAPTFAIADDAPAIGSYLTAANTSSNLPDVNQPLSSPFAWVLLNPLTVTGTATKQTTTISNSAGLSLSLINNTGSSLYTYVGQAVASTPSNLFLINSSLGVSQPYTQLQGFSGVMPETAPYYLYISSVSAPNNYSLLTACSGGRATSSSSEVTITQGSSSFLVINSTVSSPATTLTITSLSSGCAFS